MVEPHCKVLGQCQNDAPVTPSDYIDLTFRVSDGI